MITLYHLDGPVDEDVGADLPARAEDAVERPAARELHDEAEVGLLQTHPHQAYDVLKGATIMVNNPLEILRDKMKCT